MGSSVDLSSLVSKTLCDPVHGHITLHPAWVSIIDTPQFQRLRYIKQTGFCDYVFPGSTHNRFGHSIGVAFLAGTFLHQIRDRQPKLLITDVEILCVEIAGLCHDLGHGPFSHTWELFMSKELAHRKIDNNWKHENVSVNMLDYLLESNKLKPYLRKFNINDEQILMIKRMISGELISEDHPRTFLFQFVNNQASGLDVDKWDYFLRDCHYTGVHCTFDYNRLMHFALVKIVNGLPQICFRDKEAANLLNVFRTRSELHHQVYQHRVCRLLEKMFQMSIHKSGAQEIENGRSLKYFEFSMAAMNTDPAQKDFQEQMADYCRLTDLSVLNAICSQTTEAGLLLGSFLNGRNFKQIYKWIGEVILDRMETEAEIRSDILSYLPEVQSNGILRRDDLETLVIIQVSVIHWGKGHKNPIDSVYFYSKDLEAGARTWDKTVVTLDFPRRFQEVHARVYCGPTEDDNILKIVLQCFQKYREAKQNSV